MKLSNDGILIRSLGNNKLDTYYKPSRGADYMVLELHFDKLNPGENNVYIREVIGDSGYEWYGIKINNPYPTTPTTGYTESTIKWKIDEQNDGVVGIYEQIGESKYKLGCIKDGDKYKFVYLGSSEEFKQWIIGDVKAVLHSTATPYLFKADYYMLDKTKEEVYIMFDGQSMKITFEDGSSSAYLKMYPTTSPSDNNISGEATDWSGSGFALNNGYICTNYHVVEGARSIEILGVQGDFTISYSAKVVATDKFNDLALLQIDDSKFKGFGTIPYKVKTSMAEVGEDIFVLGYPMTTTMGDEIKLTNGIISSRTGFQGDVSLYQISASIQPGNSGGPLFDNQGNLIGIVSAKHEGAENVGYAIKASYLRNLMESSLTDNVLPTNNTVSSLPLTGKVKQLKKFVYFIKCSARVTTSNATFSIAKSEVSDSFNQVCLRVGEQTILSINSNQNVWFESDNTDVATITMDGQLKAISQGKTYVWAHTGDEIILYKIYVAPQKIQSKAEDTSNLHSNSTNTFSESDIRLIDVSNTNAMGLRKGESVKMTLNSLEKVWWETDDTNIITLTKDGYVKGLSFGKAIVWAHIGEKLKIYQVTVMGNR